MELTIIGTDSTTEAQILYIFDISVSGVLSRDIVPDSGFCQILKLDSGIAVWALRALISS